MIVRLPLDVDKEDKNKFKAATARNDLTMATVLKDFIRAYTRNPKIYDLIIQVNE